MRSDIPRSRRSRTLLELSGVPGATELWVGQGSDGGRWWALHFRGDALVTAADRVDPGAIAAAIFRRPPGGANAPRLDCRERQDRAPPADRRPEPAAPRRPARLERT